MNTASGTVDDSVPCHPRTVFMGGQEFRIVLSPRAMRAIGASRIVNEDIAGDCFRRAVHNETRGQLLRIIGPGHLAGPHAEGWSDYADAVAAAERVGK